MLTQDIIVIGNRWQCAVDEVTKRLYGQCKVVVVSFEELSK